MCHIERCGVMSHRGMRSKAHGIKQSGQRSQQTLTLPRLRRTARFQRRLRTGQSLVIFALSFTVLLGLAGLTIDVARAYDLYARMQRAAEAGALAGVMYMPNYYNAVRPGDVDSAVSRAQCASLCEWRGSLNLPRCGQKLRSGGDGPRDAEPRAIERSGCPADHAHRQWAGGISAAHPDRRTQQRLR